MRTSLMLTHVSFLANLSSELCQYGQSKQNVGSFESGLKSLYKLNSDDALLTYHDYKSLLRQQQQMSTAIESFLFHIALRDTAAKKRVPLHLMY